MLPRNFVVLYIIILIIIVIIISLSLVTGPFLLLLPLNQRRSPPLKLQVSDCSTFRITCDVPSTAVCCSGSIECIPGMACYSFFTPFVTIPAAPALTAIIIHFLFHIRFVSIRKLVYCNLFAAFFCATFLSARIATSISMRVFSFIFVCLWHFHKIYEKRPLGLSCLSILPSAQKNWAPTERIFMEFHIRILLENIPRKLNFHKNLKRITDTSHEDQHTASLIISHLIFLRMRNVSDKSCIGNQNTFCVQ